MFGLNKLATSVLIIFLLAAGFGAWLYTHDNKIAKVLVDKIIIEAKNLIKGDSDAVSKQDDTIGDGSIIDSLYPQSSASDRQDGNQGYSNKASNAYPYIENGLETDSGDGPTVELPNTVLPEQSSEGSPIAELLQCTYEMRIDCKTYPKCCEVLK